MSQIPKIRFKTQPAERVSGFEITRLESLGGASKRLDHDPTRLHTLGFFVMLFLEEGNVTHTVDFEHVPLRGGDCLIIAKGRAHAFDPDRKYKGWIVIFTEEFLLKNLTHSAIRKVRSLYSYFISETKFHQPLANRKFITAIKTENDYGAEASSEILGALCTLFLLELERGTAMNPIMENTRFLPAFLSFQQALEQNYAETRDAQDYARMLGYSYKHLNTICKQITGFTAKYFIDAFVVLVAKRLLASTTDTVKEIAYACGFDEPTNFLKFFKKHTGSTPGVFRGQYK